MSGVQTSNEMGLNMALKRNLLSPVTLGLLLVCVGITSNLEAQSWRRRTPRFIEIEIPDSLAAPKDRRGGVLSCVLGVCAVEGARVQTRIQSHWLRWLEPSRSRSDRRYTAFRSLLIPPIG